jgi:hypothetical protein
MAIVAPEESASTYFTKGVHLSKKSCLLISTLIILAFIGVILGLSIGLTRKHEPQCIHKFDSIDFNSCKNLSCSILEGELMILLVLKASVKLVFLLI